MTSAPEEPVDAVSESPAPETSAAEAQAVTVSNHDDTNNNNISGGNSSDNMRPQSSSEQSRSQPMVVEDPAPPVTEKVPEPSASTSPSQPRGRPLVRDELPPPSRCINPASDVNARLDTQVEVRVYPCNNSNSSKKKAASSFTIRPEGCLISGNNRNRSTNVDLGSEYAAHIGRKLQRYELSDTRACQLLVTTHAKSFWVVPAPEAFSRHSGTCRLLGDRKHPPSSHTLQVGDFLRVGSVGVVVIETHDGKENRVLSEEKIQKIMKDTTSSGGGFLDLAETDGGEWIGELI